MTSSLRAYSHPGLTKADFLAELAEHAAQDRIMQGDYWDGSKGCAVGCSLHSVSNRLKLGWANYRTLGKHSSYEAYLGIPQILAKLEDCLFEGLPLDEARKWPMRFAKAIPVGADLSGVWNRFAPWLLREVVLPAAGDEEDVRKAVIDAAEGYETNWASQTPASVRDAADAAGDIADYAGDMTGYAAADAAHAAVAAAIYVRAAAPHAMKATLRAAAGLVADATYAYALNEAGTSAADAASYAADAACIAADIDAAGSVNLAAAVSARHTAYLRMADKLRVLLAAAPVPAL